MLGQRPGRVVLGDLQARTDRAHVVADPGAGAERDGPLDRSHLQPSAPPLGHRHAESGGLRGEVLGSPRSGVTQVSIRPGQDQSACRPPAQAADLPHRELQHLRRLAHRQRPSQKPLQDRPPLPPPFRHRLYPPVSSHGGVHVHRPLKTGRNHWPTTGRVCRLSSSLRSYRWPTSLRVWFSALSISWRSTRETTSNDGMRGTEQGFREPASARAVIEDGNRQGDGAAPGAVMMSTPAGTRNWNSVSGMSTFRSHPLDDGMDQVAGTGGDCAEIPRGVRVPDSQVAE